MKFEDALKAMRSGAKIYHPTFEDDVYFMACKISLIFNENIDVDSISIVKMRGNKQHEDMLNQLPFKESCDLLDKYPFLKEKIIFPTLNLLLVMSDKWEIVND